MNIVKITNKIALVTVIGLLYWVFIFVSSTVFGFKVFRENITEVFVLSILGIVSVLLGAMVLNIMFNLTAIAEGKKQTEYQMINVARPLIAFFASLVVIFIALYVGDAASTKKKEAYLVSAASQLVEEQADIMLRLSDYSFSRDYLERAAQNISLLSDVEESFPAITIIVRDEIEGKSYLMGLNRHIYLEDYQKPNKSRFILSTSSEERTYLNAVFDGTTSAYWASSHDGWYEIYFPVRTENGVIVLYLSQRSRYGKVGS